jgi:prepilin-type N-terminal cleavage/methylation domain-containing protein
MQSRRAFTLIEVLISIALLGIIMLALFPVVSMMRDSNAQLFTYLQKAKKITQSTKVLYLDIVGSDGNITLSKDEFSRLCMEETANSLYGLNLAKVCWLVIKEKNTLVRVEGNGFTLPTRSEDKVEVDPVIQNIELFDVYHQKDKVVVLLKEKNKEPISFMVQGISKPIPKKKKPKKKPPPRRANPVKKTDTNSTHPAPSVPVI